MYTIYIKLNIYNTCTFTYIYNVITNETQNTNEQHMRIALYNILTP